MLLNFQCLLLCYIFYIIHYVIIICGVGVGFTSPSEPMRYPFGNDCEVHRSEIVQRILDSLRMVTGVCYRVMLALVYLSFMVSVA
jgi:hypothetical protein